MPLFAPPDIGKMFLNIDTKGLIKALSYRKDPSIPIAAAQALSFTLHARPRETREILFKSKNVPIEPFVAALKNYKHMKDNYEMMYCEKNHIETALKELGWTPGHIDPEIQYWVEKGDMHEVSKFSINKVTKLLKDSSFDINNKISIIKEWGKKGNAQTVKPLLEVLKKKREDYYVRRAAAQALGQLGDPSAVETLISVFESTNDELSNHILIALGQIGDTRAIDYLQSILKDGTWRQKKLATEILGDIEEPSSVDALIETLNDKNWQVQRSSAIALGKIGNPSAVQPMINLIQNQKDLFVVLAAVRALGRIGDSSVKEVFTMLMEDEDWLIQNTVLDAWQSIGSLTEISSEKVKKASHDEITSYFASILLKIIEQQSIFGGTDQDFTDQKRNYRVILVGEEINRIGGIELMRKVWQKFELLSNQGRNLEVCWGGIGEWLG